MQKTEYGFASEKHREFPPMVVVSMVNICNLKCVHCHYTKFVEQPSYESNMMRWEVWTKICDEMANYPWSILNLGTDGEPLVHKKFIAMMRYAKGKNIYPINITTNGVLLRGDLAETIVKEGLLDVINVSLDAFSRDKYQLIRGVDNHEKVYGNVHHLLELRNKFNPKVKIQVNIIDQPEVSDELEAFVNYWTSLVDNVMVRTYYDSTSITGAPGPNITGKQKSFEPEDRWPCQQFWRRFNIGDDGTARFCVDDWYNQSKIGDIRQTTIKEIWQSEVYERYRQLHLARQFTIPYCANCTEWQGMRWDYDYFVAMEKMLGKPLL